jgi:hypothetical protein
LSTQFFINQGNPGEGFPLFNCFAIENSPILRFEKEKRMSLSAESDSRLRLENSEAFL